jgi:RNA polymerase sigma factor (sigma-70 family)
MTDYRVTVKVQNNNIVKRILDAGYKSIGEFCRINEISASSLGEIINMKCSPLHRYGDFHAVVKKTALSLKCLPEELFTENQLNTSLETNQRILEIEEAELKFMLNNESMMKSLEQSVFETERTKAIDICLNSLTPRECTVISMRMGIGDYYREYTLEEIGRKFDVNRERIRQIEKKALRKLRHPCRSEQLREFIQEMR